MNELKEATTTIEDTIIIIETTIDSQTHRPTILDNGEVEINLVIEEIEVLVEIMVIITETVTIEVTIITVIREKIFH